jgi:hypothetical protein
MSDIRPPARTTEISGQDSDSSPKFNGLSDYHIEEFKYIAFQNGGGLARVESFTSESEEDAPRVPPAVESEETSPRVPIQPMTRDIFTFDEKTQRMRLEREANAARFLADFMRFRNFRREKSNRQSTAVSTKMAELIAKQKIAGFIRRIILARRRTTAYYKSKMATLSDLIIMHNKSNLFSPNKQIMKTIKEMKNNLRHFLLTGRPIFDQEYLDERVQACLSLQVNQETPEEFKTNSPLQYKDKLSLIKKKMEKSQTNDQHSYSDVLREKVSQHSSTNILENTQSHELNETESYRNPKFPFLKRKTKKIEAQKIEYLNIQSKVDCWKQLGGISSNPTDKLLMISKQANDIDKSAQAWLKLAKANQTTTAKEKPKTSLQTIGKQTSPATSIKPSVKLRVPKSDIKTLSSKSSYTRKTNKNDEPYAVNHKLTPVFLKSNNRYPTVGFTTQVPKYHPVTEKPHHMPKSTGPSSRQVESRPETFEDISFSEIKDTYLNQYLEKFNQILGINSFSDAEKLQQKPSLSVFRPYKVVVNGNTTLNDIAVNPELFERVKIFADDDYKNILNN